MAAQDAVGIGRAGEALLDGTTQEAHQADGPGEDFGLGQAAALLLVTSGETPEGLGRGFRRRQHLGAAPVGHAAAPHGGHRQHRTEIPGAGDPAGLTPGRQRRGRQEAAAMDGEQRTPGGDEPSAPLVVDAQHLFAEVVGRRLHLEQRDVRVAVERDVDAVDLDDFHHAAAGRDGPEEMGGPRVTQGQPVGVGMGVADVDGLETGETPALPEKREGIG